MALFFSSLNSGSNANSYYVGTRQAGVLIDCGLSLRLIRQRLKSLGLSEHCIKALFISHEHTDHIRSLPDCAKYLNVPVYSSEATWSSHHFFTSVALEQRHVIHCGDSISIGDMQISCFAKRHDGVDPFSFMIERQGARVGIFTDVGSACSKLIKAFSSCHAAVLEANYDEDMLMNGKYPFFLKRRISSDHGHLSNQQALALFKQYRNRHLKLLLLGHLSKENNHPSLVENLFKPHAGKTTVMVASRTEASPLFHISGAGSVFTEPKGVQLSLWDS